MTFTSGIVLNIHDLFFSHQITEVKPTKLFYLKKINRKELLSTQYMHFNDPQCTLIRANPNEFAGPRNGTMQENVPKITDPKFVCEMSCKEPDGRPFNLPHCVARNPPCRNYFH